MPSILLVDDTDLFRGAASEVTKRTGGETLSATGGTQALDIVRQQRPQMLIVRAGMRGMTGMDLCRGVKAEPAFSRMAIVPVASAANGAAATAAGADAVLPEPLDPEAVFAAVRRFLQVMPREEARSAVEWSITFWREG